MQEEHGLSEPKRVVVTLTGTGGEWLTVQARTLGWQAAHWAGLTFEAADKPAVLATHFAAALAEADWLALTSPQGVRSLAEVTPTPNAAKLRAKLRVAAVGEGTARLLANWGCTVDFIPSRADARTLAAELPARAAERVLHITGTDSREHLGRGLTERGIGYQRLALYCSAPTLYSETVREAIQAADMVVVGSGVAVLGLVEQCGTGLPLLAMGQQTAQAALDAGFDQVTLAREPSLAGVLRTLVDCFG